MQIIQKFRDLFNVKQTLDISARYSDVNFKKFKYEIIQNRLTLGKILEIENRKNTNLILENIHLAEFKIFSQWGDDGIINFLINYLDIENKTFVEFGVESYTECNTRFLLINNNWKGLIIDGSEDYMNGVRNENIYWQYNLKAVDSFVTAENINEILKYNGITGKIGLLHVDIDGNDYWVWKAIEVVDPDIVIVEFNSLFGFEKPYTVPYDPAFIRGNKHYSNLYYGVSLMSIFDLANEKGYGFIGCNSNGNNAYFVKNDKLKGLKKLSIEQGYIESMFSEGRDIDGKLSFLRGKDRLKLIEGLPVYNTRNNRIEKI